MKRILLVLIITFIAVINSEAKYRQTCVVKYATRDGWSKAYTVDVTFLSGFELNQAIGTYNYSTYSTYGVIFWGEGKATVIKLSSYLVCGNEVTKSCITSTYTDLKGKDQDDDEWKICVSDYCY